MNIGLTLLIFGPAIASICYVIAGVNSCQRKLGSDYLGVMAGGILVWLVGYAIQLNVHHTGLHAVVAQVQFVGIVAVPVSFFLFALEYTRGYDLSTAKKAALVAVPGLTLALILTNPLHGLVWGDYGTQTWRGLVLPVREFRPWFGVHLVYSYGLLLAGVALFADLLTADAAGLRRQSTVVIAGTLVALVTAALYPLGLSPVPGFDLTPFGFTVLGILLWYAFDDTAFYDVVPAVRSVGWSNVADQVDSGIVVTDMDLTIVEVNRVACDLFAVEREAVVGEPIPVLIGDDEIDATPAGVYELRRTGGEVYHVEGSSLANNAGYQIGYSFTVTDVTARKRREKRLKVLNRALRHNLRNKVTLINAKVADILDRVDSETADDDEIGETAADLLATADQINEMGETARLIDEVIQNPSVQRVDIARAIRASVDGIRSMFPNSSVSVDVDEPLYASANPFVGKALTHVLRNAFEHNRPADTTAHVTARSASDSVIVTITDDGRGISDYEIRSLENGAETPLDHGSGLGLWLVKWVVEVSGGDLSIESDSEGTTIELRFDRWRSRSNRDSVTGIDTLRASKN